MAEWAYHFYDFSTRRKIDTLPMENVRFGREHSGVGTLSGEIPMYDSGLPAHRVRDAIYAYRTKIYVERGGQLVWGGWLHEEPAYSSETGRVTINAEETLGYFSHRFLPTVEFWGVDQLEIARQLIEVCQAEPGGDMWLHVDPAVMSGVLRDRSYSRYDKTPALTALMQLSEVISGFEVSTQVVWDAGVPHELLLLGYPRIGRALRASGLVWEYDRFVTSEQTLESFTWGPSQVSLATRCFADSETDEGVQLTAMSERPDLVSAGYPLIDHAEMFDGVQEFTTLQAHADALQAFRSVPRVTATATAKAQPGLEIGDFLIGDDVLCRISDYRFPPGEDGAPGFIGYLRIVGYDCTPGPEGIETYTFTLADIGTFA